MKYWSNQLERGRGWKPWLVMYLKDEEVFFENSSTFEEKDDKKKNFHPHESHPSPHYHFEYYWRGPRNVWFKLQIYIFTHIDDSGYSHAERRTLLGCLVLKLLFVNQSFGQKNRLLTYPRRYNVWQMKFKCCWKEKILCLVCNYPRTKVITSNDKTTESSCKLAKVWTSVSSSKILGFPLLLVNIINVSLWQSCELVPLSRLLKKGKTGRH